MSSTGGTEEGYPLSVIRYPLAGMDFIGLPERDFRLEERLIGTG
jgi:hypothetical protein